ncbi:MAG: methyltransferase domain-containing protein [Candidatus Shapirobacteria bacterium]|nr:methyltransferase domain-containing protein [Candidatus Shapirobacteria bacterium]MDD5073750.1 methyltransferase domain-containing protein [Candidatus Shapirobacteria bacterium]MDD5481649.1 methyltransferase domain-containing protein [Candidatus Shapirobacteria bacterium]
MAFYDHYNYQRYWRGREYEHEAEIVALEKLFGQIPLKNRQTILDVGAGFGRLTPIYANRFVSCVLLEPSQKLINQAKRKLQYQNLEFKSGQGESFQLKTKFDVVLTVRVAHHIQDLPSFLKNINHHLKDNGFLILEFANKTNFKACLKALFEGNWSFLKNLASTDRRSPANINQETILFLNHHPVKVREDLKQSGFEVVTRLSVSNFRWPILKKFVPTGILLRGEKILQLFLAKINFGPSIFILAQKQ